VRPLWRRKFIDTTDSRHALPVAENVLTRRFAPATANTAWVCDITYIRTRSGWLYLAAVLDLFSRKMAIAQRRPPAGLLVHSDRGSQYASELHRALLTRHCLTASMSRKGNCWDNAVMERFFLKLKMECVWRRDYANHAEAIRDVTDYIISFYNNVRLHSTLGYLPPTAYERKMADIQPIEASEIT